MHSSTHGFALYLSFDTHWHGRGMLGLALFSTAMLTLSQHLGRKLTHCGGHARGMGCAADTFMTAVNTFSCERGWFAGRGR